MKFVKKTAEYNIFQRNDQRYAVQGKSRKWINGDKKVEILQTEGLLKKPEPKPAAQTDNEPSADA